MNVSCLCQLHILLALYVYIHTVIHFHERIIVHLSIVVYIKARRNHHGSRDLSRVIKAYGYMRVRGVHR